VQVFGRRNAEPIHALRRPGVRKAPRHEIAVGGALAVQRGLWGFCGRSPTDTPLAEDVRTREQGGS
jgi:hypothetical protein